MLCREVECAGGGRSPTGVVVEMTPDELAEKNRSLVRTTLRYFPLTAAELEALVATPAVCSECGRPKPSP